MEVTKKRIRRTMRMTKEEHKAFKIFVDKSDTKLDATIALGISRPTLDLIYYKGSAKEDTINKIRNFFSKAK